MATDVEESDTEDHERPVPPKRQCRQVVQENAEQMVYQTSEQNENLIEIEREYERNERLTLERWQACQVAKGFVDNTINRVMENYILGPQADPSQFRLFRGTEMENTAVMMAIKNHGLVPDSDADEFGTFIDDKETWNNSNNDVIHNHSNSQNKLIDENIPYATTSTDEIFTIGQDQNVGQDDDKEIGDEHDFLERAVAEAIKIKGLGARSFDYG